MYRLSALAMMLLLALTCYGQDPLEVSLNVSEVRDTEMDLELTVNNFTNLALLQLFVFWDEEVLEVTEFVESAPELVGFIGVLPSQEQNPIFGKVTINWAFDGINAITLPDGTAICKFTLQYKAPECSTTEFTIRDLGDAMTSPSLIVDAQILVGNDFVPIGVADVEPLPFQVPGVSCSTSTEEEEEIATVRIYPNPVRDNLQVSFNNHQPNESSLMLYNEDGRLLSSNPLRHMESNIDISEINNGIYFYEIQDKGIVVNQGKIMKI